MRHDSRRARCHDRRSGVACRQVSMGTGSALERALLAHADAAGPLVVIDVGCRWGAAEHWMRLGNHVLIVGIDPDAQECARLKEGVDPDRACFVPLALAATGGTRVLHVTTEPACSSLYPPEDEVVAAFPGFDISREVGIQTIEVTTLDAWTA